MALLDFFSPQDSMLAKEMQDLDLTYEDLRDHKEFLSGVMSAFFMPEPVEKWFWNKVNTAIDEPILHVSHEEAESIDEGVDTLIAEIEVEDTVFTDEPVMV
tara:strand:- start:2288 stop:2590 length:303 start_codon:yes stop_codon:yes gene_type:complete